MFTPSQNETRGPGRHRMAILCALALVCVVLAILAYWAPWIDHDAAALKLSGQDLGEFVKFIPQISSGQRRFPRQLFYLPPFASVVSLALLAVNRHTVYRRWLRAAMLGLALLVLPGILPPVWGHPRELFAPEYRLQGLALILGLLVILGHALLRRVALPWLGGLLTLTALLALVPAQAAFWAIRPYIWDIYDTPTIRLGWGLWLDLLAWAGMAAFGVLLARQKRRGSRD